MHDMPDIIPMPQARPDLDIGVVYTHERDLMPPLLSTLKASGNGLRMRSDSDRQRFHGRCGLLSRLFPGNHCPAKHPAPALCGESQSRAERIDGKIHSTAQYRHVF